MRIFVARALLLLFYIFISSGCSPHVQEISGGIRKQHEELIIAGSGSNLFVTKKLADGFKDSHPINIEIPDSIGSGGGITGVRTGRVDLGLTSRPLMPEETSGLVEIPYARSGLAVAVGKGVSDDNVTYHDLVEIYQGRKEKWENGEAIIVFIMYEKDSTNEVLQREIPGFREALMDSFRNKRWQVFYNQQSQEEAIANTPHSIGFINMPVVVDGKLKVLNVNGVKPSAENILNNDYKLFKTLNYVYKEPLRQEGRDFIDFTFAKRGQEILMNNQCIALRK